MVLSEGGLTRVSPAHRSILFSMLIVMGAVVAASLVVAGEPGGQLIRIGAAVFAAAFAFRGWRAGEGRERQARGWIAIALVVWLASEIGRLAATLLGVPPHLMELSLLGLAVAAAGTYVTTVRGRVRRVDEAALYLDVAGVFFGLLGAGLVLGSSLISDRTGFGILLHAAFFIALLAATLLINLSTRVRLRFNGAWEVLAGIALGATGYVGLLLPSTSGLLESALHATVATGVLIGGHGGEAGTPTRTTPPGSSRSRARSARCCRWRARC